MEIKEYKVVTGVGL